MQITMGDLHNFSREYPLRIFALICLVIMIIFNKIETLRKILRKILRDQLMIQIVIHILSLHDFITIVRHWFSWNLPLSWQNPQLAMFDIWNWFKITQLLYWRHMYIIEHRILCKWIIIYYSKHLYLKSIFFSNSCNVSWKGNFYTVYLGLKISNNTCIVVYIFT